MLSTRDKDHATVPGRLVQRTLQRRTWRHIAFSVLMSLGIAALPKWAPSEETSSKDAVAATSAGNSAPSEPVTARPKSSSNAASAPSVDPQADKDRTVVEALLRLPNVQLASFPTARQSLLRHLRRNAGSDQFFQLTRRFQLTELSDVLLALAVDHSTDSQGVEAARLLLDLGQEELVAKQIAKADEHQAAALVTALGLTDHAKVQSLMEPLVDDTEAAAALRRAAIVAYGRSTEGKNQLIQRLKDNKFSDDLHVTLGRVLLATDDESVRAQAQSLLKLPTLARNVSLPPLDELITMTGDAGRGAMVFRQDGTCIKCHQVGNEGQQVGPALSEIGSKLSREAMFLSILDPSAAVNFGYETYSVLLTDGQTLTGVIISQTDQEVTLRSAEALTRTIERTQIDEITKHEVSMMPAGLLQNLTTQQLVDVVEYLLTLRKPDESARIVTE